MCSYNWDFLKIMGDAICDAYVLLFNNRKKTVKNLNFNSLEDLDHVTTRIDMRESVFNFGKMRVFTKGKTVFLYIGRTFCCNLSN